MIRFQIKTMQKDGTRKVLPVRKISHNQGEYKIRHYTSDEVDFFVGSDIEEENLYIVPIDFISQYRSSIGSTKLEPYKNNFSQLEPLVGNN